jgi:ketosteroid isomerase-like protein
MAGMAQTFAEALQRTEESRDPDHVARLFAPDAELSNYTHRESGIEGARRFWFTYLEQFSDIRSTFSRIIEEGGQAALVWTSEGTLKGGQPIAYSGVSIIEADGDKVRRFETYYDSAVFLRPESSPSGNS